MSGKAPAAGTPLPKKLGIDGDVVFTVRREPAGFAEQLGDIGAAVWQRSLLAPLDLIVAFHTHRIALEADWPRLTAPVAPDGAIWVAVPRRGAGIDSDLTEDVVRSILLPTGWVDDKSISVDDTWTALRFVRRKDERHRRRR